MTPLAPLMTQSEESGRARKRNVGVPHIAVAGASWRPHNGAVKRSQSPARRPQITGLPKAPRTTHATAAAMQLAPR